MPPTPIVPNGEVRLSYTVASLVHILRLRVDINNPSGAAPFLLNLFGGGTAVWSTLVPQFDAFVGTFYSAATAFGLWTLLQRVDSNYIPLDSAASGAAGSNPGADEATGQLTLVQKDVNNKVMKTVFLESAFVAPQKATSGVFLGAGGLLADMENTANGHIGSWVKGRDGNPPFRSISAVVSLNRKIRRRRGLA